MQPDRTGGVQVAEGTGQEKLKLCIGDRDGALHGNRALSKNVHQKHYPASITKIMTSLLTLENSSPSDVVTFTEAEAHGIETGSSSMYCVPGEKFTIEQVL